MENIAKEVSNFVSRTIGWITLDFALYQGHSLLSRRKKRETFQEDFISKENDEYGN